jgi:hypothetical protein
MDYQKVQSTHEASLKQAYHAGQASNPTAPIDPASLRQQYSALCVLVERLASHRNRLRSVADVVLGEEPPEACGTIKGNSLSTGGVTAEIVTAFENAGDLLLQIDRQIERLERVSR